MRAPDRLPYSSLAPTVVALAMAGSGLGAWDYHLGLAVAPVSAWAAAVAMGRWLQRIGGLQGPLACILLGPLAVAAAVAPWQPACNVVDSAALWALGPAAAGLWGLGIGALAALAPSRGGARAVLAALYAGAALPAAAHFLQSPQIDAYLPHAGHVAGALYEDAVAVGWRDVAYRLADLAWLIPVIAVASELRTRDQPWSLAALRRLARGHRAIGWALWTAALAMATAAWLAGEQRWRTPQAGFE
ncbi:MAG: hypothetical protein FJ100_20305, partial [Deltaproteobacteria bacterium]|nr:hypothetical protein [Deltaproteobacteria bacterium]